MYYVPKKFDSILNFRLYLVLVVCLVTSLLSAQNISFTPIDKELGDKLMLDIKPIGENRFFAIDYNVDYPYGFSRPILLNSVTNSATVLLMDSELKIVDSILLNFKDRMDSNNLNIRHLEPFVKENVLYFFVEENLHGVNDKFSYYYYKIDLNSFTLVSENTLIGKIIQPIDPSNGCHPLEELGVTYTFATDKYCAFVQNYITRDAAYKRVAGTNFLVFDGKYVTSSKTVEPSTLIHISPTGGLILNNDKKISYLNPIKHIELNYPLIGNAEGLKFSNFHEYDSSYLLIGLITEPYEVKGNIRYYETGLYYLELNKKFEIIKQKRFAFPDTLVANAYQFSKIKHNYLARELKSLKKKQFEEYLKVAEKFNANLTDFERLQVSFGEGNNHEVYGVLESNLLLDIDYTTHFKRDFIVFRITDSSVIYNLEKRKEEVSYLSRDLIDFYDSRKSKYYLADNEGIYVYKNSAEKIDSARVDKLVWPKFFKLNSISGYRVINDSTMLFYMHSDNLKHIRIIPAVKPGWEEHDPYYNKYAASYYDVRKYLVKGKHYFLWKLN